MPVEITIGQSLLPLFTNRDPFVFVEGPRGTGKTRAILSILMCRALEYPGSRWALWRSTRTRLSETVLQTLEEQVFPAFGLSVPGGAGTENRHRYDLPNGSSFLPIGLDDPLRSTSLEVAGGYVAEAIEIPKLDDVLALAGALRQQVPGLDFHQLVVDCNPGSPSHWLNTKAESVPASLRRVESRADYDRLQEHNRAPAVSPLTRWKRLITRHQDNPGYFDVDRWDWKPPGKQYIQTTLATFGGHLRRRWLDGDWVAAEGTVYPEFDDQRHVMQPFPIPDYFPIFWGYDSGYDHPTAILWFTVAPNGTLYIIDEIHIRQKGVPELAAMVKAREAAQAWQPSRRYGDPQSVFSRTAMSPRTLASQWQDHGIRISPWPRTAGNSETMVEAVRRRLTAGTLKVFATCQATISEFQTWSYKRSAKGELPPGDDQYQDCNNDALDVVRGVVATNPQHKSTGIRVGGGR